MDIFRSIETIKLDEKQIAQLLFDKYLPLGEDKILEIVEEDIILNKNGYASRATSINIQLEEYRVENRSTINTIRNLICEHLNFEPYEVIFLARCENEYQFKIKPGSNILYKIIVYERSAVECLDDYFYDNEIKTIGPYKQLCDSRYFFRWLDEENF